MDEERMENWMTRQNFQGNNCKKIIEKIKKLTENYNKFNFLRACFGRFMIIRCLHTTYEPACDLIN
jgi:hypothetical protein